MLVLYQGNVLREYSEEDVPQMVSIWNSIVEDGNAFPQTDFLDNKSGLEFFKSQSFCGIYVNDTTNDVLGFYILHPNYIGRCAHIANASFAVKESARGMHVGQSLVKHCIRVGRRDGFKVLQLNAVVKNNIAAVRLYESTGFVKLGEIPDGFRLDDGFANINVYYKKL